MKVQVIKQEVAFMNKIINMSPRFESEDGNCFVKCLQEIYLYNNIEMTTSDILMLCDCFLLQYNPNEKGRISIYLNYKNLNKLPVDIIKERFDNQNEGILKIKEEIINNRLVVLIVNTYYLYYTDDYLKKSGGLFGGGHALIIKGFDDEKESFIICDPTFNIEEAYVSYEEMCLAWTYTKDSKFFKPLIMFCFEKRQGEDFNKHLVKEALKKDLEKYVSGINYSSESICKWLYDFRDALELDIDAEKKKKILLNVAYSILHEIRWSRKSIGLALKKWGFSKNINLNIYANKFENYFNKWSKIHNLIYIGIKTEDIERIKKSYTNSVLLLNEEIDDINSILEYIF